MRESARRLVTMVEPLILALLLYVFWFPEPVRILALALILPILALRLAAYGRLMTPTPMHAVLLAFLLLGIINVFVAPFEYADATITFAPLGLQFTLPYLWITLSRLVLGMVVFLIIVEHMRLGRRNAVLVATVLLALVVAFWALVATQWNAKSMLLIGIIGLLPEMRDTAFLPGGFNANEVAGALAWLTPLCAALALYPWRFRPIQVGAAAAFSFLLLSLFLGQSRFALAGVVAALFGVIVLLIHNRRGRAVALAALAAFVVLEAAVALNIFAPVEHAETMQTRDESSLGRRFDMWLAVVDVVRDHPLTGVGMNMFRARHVRAVYPVPTYENRVLPHAHNELMQVAADFGVPGIVLFVALYGVSAWMLWRIWRRGDASARVVAVGVSAGLLAHGVFGIGDAIALWDRFGFVFWWLLGLGAGQYALLRVQAQMPDEKAAQPELEHQPA